MKQNAKTYKPISVKVVSLIMVYWSMMPDPLMAKDCEKNKVYCSILKINPKVDKDNAYKLSNYLYKYAHKYKVDPSIAVAIVAQESMFRDIDTDMDSGIFQFNKGTIAAYKLDKLRLKFDLEYATEEFIKMIDRKSGYCQDKEYPWGCYHSSTEVYYNKYIMNVTRYLNILKGE